MMELSRNRLTSRPLTRPAPTANAIAMTTAAPSRELSPSGSWVTTTTASEIPPATDRSMPPCCTTSSWPSPAIASTAANGTMPMIALGETLDGATIAPRTKTPIVAVAIATKPRDMRNRERFRRVASWVAASVTMGPADRSGTTQSLRRVLSETVQKLAPCSQAPSRWPAAGGRAAAGSSSADGTAGPVRGAPTTGIGRAMMRCVRCAASGRAVFFHADHCVQCYLTCAERFSDHGAAHRLDRHPRSPGISDAAIGNDGSDVFTNL